MNYYKNQLDKIKDTEYFKTIIITDGEGNKTKNVSLNTESIPILIKYLDLELEKQNKTKD